MKESYACVNRWLWCTGFLGSGVLSPRQQVLYGHAKYFQHNYRWFVLLHTKCRAVHKNQAESARQYWGSGITPEWFLRKNFLDVSHLATKIQRWLLNFLKLWNPASDNHPRYPLPCFSIYSNIVQSFFWKTHLVHYCVFFTKELVRFEVSTAVLLRIQILGNAVQCCCRTLV